MAASVFAHVAAPAIPELEEDVLALLRRGAAAARTGKDLAAILGTSERDVRGAVDSLLKTHDILVCSSTEPPRGYFIAATDAERSRYHSQLVSRLREVADRARRVKRLPLYGSALPEAQLQLLGEED